MMYLAHRAEDGREQSILEHNSNVAALCAAFAAPTTLGNTPPGSSDAFWGRTFRPTTPPPAPRKS